MMSFFEVPLSLSARAVPTIVHRAVLLPAAATARRLCLARSTIVNDAELLPRLLSLRAAC